MIIALDGPAASGKGAIGQRLAAHYGLAYLDTGKLYRAAALAARRAGAAIDDGAAVAAVARRIELAALDDPALLTQEAGQDASRVAALREVREALLALQRDFARRPGGAVLDGRDIGTVVCPEADAKLFITASPKARAARRAAELRSYGQEVDEDALAADLAQRDARDAGRSLAPMRPAADARLLDTTDLSIDAAFEAARRLVAEALAAKTG